MNKLLTVASNGQISIGKEWAGRQILIEQIGVNELRILSGTFIPDKDLPFHTAEAKETLKDFNEWAGDNPPKKSDRKDLIARLEKKARDKAKA